MHLPCADVQLQREERISLGSGPKRQHSGVQALQNTHKKHAESEGNWAENKETYLSQLKQATVNKETREDSEENAAGSKDDAASVHTDQRWIHAGTCNQGLATGMPAPATCSINQSTNLRLCL